MNGRPVVQVIAVEQPLGLALDHLGAVGVAALDDDVVFGVLDRRLELPREELPELVLDLVHVGLDDVVLALVLLAGVKDDHAGVGLVHPVPVLLVEVGLLLHGDRLLQVVATDDRGVTLPGREEIVLVELLVDVDGPLLDEVSERVRGALAVAEE